MWGLVEDNAIIKIINQPKGMVIGNTRHSRKIFSLWSEAELNNVGLYSVVFDNSNKKDEAYYNNTNQSFAFADGVVTASYGLATAKAHADSLWTQQDSNDGLLPSDKSVGDVKVEGLKTIKITNIKKLTAGILQDTDWYIVRNADAGTAVPSAITNYRASVRTKCAEMETAITNAANTAAIQTLYAYVNTGTEENPVMERPLGEFPEAV